MRAPRSASSARGRGLGLWMATALVVGNMIGSGVFLLPASLGSYGGISIVGWLVSSSGALLLALVFARLSRLIPKAGGPYAYTREGFGDFAGFLVAWGYWISIWVANAAIAVAFVSYLTVFVPALDSAPALAAAVGVMTVWVLTGVNIVGVRRAGVVQLVTTVLKLVPLVAIATLGLLFFDGAHFSPFNASGGPATSAVTATVALTLWAFLGFESATVPAEDVVDPTRTIPRATLLGTSLAAVVYILGTAAVMGIIPPAELAVSSAPFADAARAIWGNWAAFAVGAGAVVSCFGALNGWILLQGQVPRAAANDGLFPAPFGRLSAQGTPWLSLVLSSVLVSLLMTMNYTKSLVEQFTFIILLATLTALVPYTFSSMAVLMMVFRGRQREEPRRVLGLVALATLAFLFSLWAIAGAGKDVVYWGFLLLIAGVPVYVWLAWQRGEATRQ